MPHLIDVFEREHRFPKASLQRTLTCAGLPATAFWSPSPETANRLTSGLAASMSTGVGEPTMSTPSIETRRL